MRWHRLLLVPALALVTAAPVAAIGAVHRDSVFLHAAAMLEEEAGLLALTGPAHGADPGFAANRGRLEYVDGAGAADLQRIRAGGIRPDEILARTLDRLPVPGPGTSPPPPPDEYRAAIDELRALHAARGGEPAFALGEGSARRADGGTSTIPALIGGAAIGALAALFLASRARRRRGRAADDLIAAAMTDPLTGAANRRRLDQDIAAMAFEALAPVSVLMIDVDRFKSVNDRHGHVTGDEVLRRVSRVLAEQVRSGATVYRYGGEEFCVVLPGASPADARVVADRVRAAVAAAPMPTREPVTISLGVASGTAGRIAVVIRRADAALYDAKRAGRDRIEVSSEPRWDPDPLAQTRSGDALVPRAAEATRGTATLPR